MRERRVESMDPVRNAECDILRYLIAHRDARDTVEGIEKWWLPSSREYAMADVCAALRKLEQAELVKVWKMALAPPLYGRFPDDDVPLQRYLKALQ